MKTRINGSHLKRKHNITIIEYKKNFPESNIGIYKNKEFNCHICNDIFSNNSAIKNKHLKDCHGITVDEYNIKYCIKICECGCGQISYYSYVTHQYKKFVKGHYKVWNYGLTKNDHPGIMRQSIYIKNNNPMKLQSTIDKMLDHPNSKWTEERIERRTKSYQKTMFDKYGVDNYRKSEQCKQQLEKTWKKIYGVSNPQQNPEVHERNIKSRFDYKDYILPSGKLIRVQGFEPQALDILIKNYTEIDIITIKKNMPEIWYEENNKKRRYFPDIFIEKENKFIEVKSTYTYDRSKDNIILKCNAVLQLGYKIEIWVLDKNGTLLKEYKYE